MERLARAKQGSEWKSPDYPALRLNQGVQPQCPDAYESKRTAVCVLSAGSHVGMRILLLVDGFVVQQLYRPAAILLGSRNENFSRAISLAEGA